MNEALLPSPPPDTIKEHDKLIWNVGLERFKLFILFIYIKFTLFMGVELGLSK
jgi:hypothetical protein